uniref:Uncharacterized protein n=1 Tax=Anguilla anguilla TaxID=7936 RepID=A0A0E9SX28_ANGAN
MFSKSLFAHFSSMGHKYFRTLFLWHGFYNNYYY